MSNLRRQLRRKGYLGTGRIKGKMRTLPFNAMARYQPFEEPLIRFGFLRILLRVAPRFFFFSNSTPSFFFRVIKFMAAQRGLNLD